ncbi:hypothetical protein MNBD_NITROSPINAE02-568 [hydrothermal vent metagenome]|uniref:Uncharacterized protein n=1 Tax=hydrothermal vent metagenome TaxID=652676 RepID=A0A3B1CM89_9ZZZZ
MAISVVNDNGSVAREARNLRTPPTAPPEGADNQNRAPEAQAPAAEAQNNQIATETDTNASVVIRRLTPLDVVERNNAPDIEPVPQQVNVPDPFTNLIPDGESPVLQAQIARLAPDSPENGPAQAAVNAVRTETQSAAPEPPQNGVEAVAAATAETGTQAVESQVTEPQVTQPTEPQPTEPQPTEPAANAGGVAAASAANNTAERVQQAEGDGQERNNPIAEQEIGGTVNIAV